jgi:hypothetical protein
MAGLFYKVGLARQGITKRKGLLSWTGLVEEYLETLMDVFSTAPIKRGSNYYSKDTSTTAKLYNIVFWGNSITLGTESCVGSVTKSYPQLLTETIISQLKNNCTYVNKGVGGYKGADMATHFATDVTPHFVNDGETINLLFVFEFANDMYYGATAQQAYDNIKSCCQQAKATGWVVYPLTAPYSTRVTNIDDANILLLQDHSFADGVINQYSVLGQSVMSNSIYSCDGTHLKDAGIAIQVNYILSQIISQNIITSASHIRRDVQIKNTPYPTLITGEHINTNRIPGSAWTLVFEGILTIPTTGGPYDILSPRTNPYVNGDFSLYIQTGVFKYFFVTSAGVEVGTTTLYNTLNGFYKILFSFDTSTKVATLTFEYNGSTFTHTKTMTGTIYTCTNPVHIFGRNIFGSGKPFMWKKYNAAYTTFAQLNEANLVQWACFNEGNGATINDLSGNGVDLTIENYVSLDTIWSNRSDIKKPQYIYNGFTLFQNATTPTMFIFATYDKNGLATKTSISGYNKLAEIPANCISQTGNTFTIPESDENVLPAGTYNYDQLYALIQTAYLRITKTANYISNLKVRSKQ